MRDMDPRVLIISNDCISNVTSNGRTLRNFLQGWDRDKLAQFCIHNVFPDFETCSQYFCVSDQDALRAFKTGKSASGEMILAKEHNTGAQTGHNKRNALTMMIRNLVWDSMRWAGENFFRWVDTFAPELILLQAGDCSFMLKLARKLSVRYHIPLVIYNSEAYYFKDFDYFCSNGIEKFFYPMFLKQFRFQFRKTIQQADMSIYCCDKLKNDYDTEFELPSTVIYTATQMKPLPKKHCGKSLTVSYLGNLGVGRHEGLIEIANALQMISPDYYLDVYGKIPNSYVEEAFKQCEGIRYKGFVNYDEVIRIQQTSDILVHTENFSEFYRKDLKYAFSTKIADSMASGVCFVLYAPAEMACAEYLTDNSAAHLIDSKEKLLPVLKKLIEDEEERSKYLQNAQDLVKRNHNSEINAKRFKELLIQCVSNSKD